MAELLEFDPTSEDAANAPLSVMNASYRVLSHSYPAPPLNVLYASSIDTEGEIPAARRYGNRVISMSMEMVDATGALLRALQAKAAKIAREGGTLKRTLATGQVIVFDLLSSEQFDPTFDVAYYAGNLVKVDLVLGAKPLGRGPEVTLTDHPETTLPYLAFTEGTIAGDVPALGRLVIDEDQATDQSWVIWGLQQRYYSSASTAALYYEAEGRTPLGAGAALAAGPFGATGAGSNSILANALATDYLAVMSTQAASGGAHLSHVGEFRVLARVQAPASNTGGVTLALEWSQGDFRSPTRNAEYPLTPNPASFTNGWRGVWLLADLGFVSLTPATAGVQRWEGRILAKSTSLNDDVYIDSIYLIPCAEGGGITTSGLQRTAPSSFAVRDEFDQTSGALAGKAAPVGGTWTGGGSATDFTIDATNGVAQRTALSDAGGSVANGRVAWVGTATATNLGASVDVQAVGSPSGPSLRGLALRVTDASNYLIIGVSDGSPLKLLTAYAVVGGTATGIGSLLLPNQGAQTAEWQSLWAYVTPSGVVYASYGTQGSPGTPKPIAFSTHLATGGTLATGKAGVFDYYALTATYTRRWDNLRVWSPVADAAMFASQSLEIRHDGVNREDATGTVWSSPNYEGSYLRIPPSGAENRTTRLIVKASRNEPRYGPDGGVDDISARLYVTPRYLVIP